MRLSDVAVPQPASRLVGRDGWPSHPDNETTREQRIASETGALETFKPELGKRDCS